MTRTIDFDRNLFFSLNFDLDFCSHEKNTGKIKKDLFDVYRYNIYKIFIQERLNMKRFNQYFWLKSFYRKKKYIIVKLVDPSMRLDSKTTQRV